MIGKETIINNVRIEVAIKTHNGKYRYDKTNFSRVKNKTIVTCPIHGDFETTFDNHCNRKRGCPKCGKTMKLTNEEFIEKVNKEFNSKYDTSKCIYINMHTNVTLICPIHGEFQRTPIELLYYHRGCNKCNDTVFSLEKQIEDLLIENNINYIPQYKIEWLQYQSLDFYLPDYNVAIECQGKQHFGKGGWSDKYNFEEQKERDERKFNLCKENNVKLLYFSNLIPKYEYFDKVYTNKNELLKSIRYLLVNNDLKIN